MLCVPRQQYPKQSVGHERTPDRLGFAESSLRIFIAYSSDLPSRPDEIPDEWQTTSGAVFLFLSRFSSFTADLNGFMRGDLAGLSIVKGGRIRCCEITFEDAGVLQKKGVDE